jgi:hypothetical protein
MGNHRAVPDGRHGIADSGLQSHTDVGHRKGTQKMGIHRMPRKPSVMTRTVAAGGVAAGGAACCLGLLGDGTLPTANAFSASFVEPNGTTVQLNILQGNVINPQFNPGGNSSNTSTIGNLFAGQGNGNTTNVGVTSTGSGSQTTNTTVSNGNVVQINILSGNVFNPQLSLFGGNSSTTSTIGNASIGNGNGNPTNVGVVSTGSGSQTTNTTVSNGNSTQIDILSGNVFNPQLSLFGGNSSTTSTIGNASIGNGNGNPTNVGVVSTGSGSQTTNTTVSNGNSTQTAFGSGNVFNPQLSLFGGNSSNTSTLGNAAIGNGNGNFTGVGVTSTGTGSGTTVGVTNTEGNSNQKTNLSGNIINPQLSSGLGSGTPLSTPFSVGSRTPLSTPVSSAAGANGTSSKRHVSFGRS